MLVAVTSNHCKNFPLPKFIEKNIEMHAGIFFLANKIGHFLVSSDIVLFFLFLKSEGCDRLSVPPFCALTSYLVCKRFVLLLLLDLHILLSQYHVYTVFLFVLFLLLFTANKIPVLFVRHICQLHLTMSNCYATLLHNTLIWPEANMRIIYG